MQVENISFYKFDENLQFFLVKFAKIYIYTYLNKKVTLKLFFVFFQKLKKGSILACRTG